jgi:hypothetical protein
VKLTGEEENDWHHSKSSLWVQSDKHSTCDSAHKVCDQYLARQHKELKMEKAGAEHRAAFLNAPRVPGYRFRGSSFESRHLPTFLSCSGPETESTQTHEDNWRSPWMKT